MPNSANCKLTKKALPHILRHAFCLRFLTITSSKEALKVWKHNFFQEIQTENCVTYEAVARRCSIKKVHLETLHRCFPANFAKFLRRSFLTEDFRWLLLLFVINLFNYDASKLTFFMLNMVFDVLSMVFVK